MSLFKSFSVPFHSSALQLRADAFNVLNHPSFSNPGHQPYWRDGAGNYINTLLILDSKRPRDSGRGSFDVLA